MTATTISPAKSGPIRTAGQGKLKGYIAFAICASLYILPLIRLYLVGTDEGTLDYGAVRVAHGQVFARDFFEVMGPGTFYWLAGFFKIFGVSFLATRICLFLTSMGTALLMYFLSRRVCGTNQLLPPLILAGTIFPGLWPATSHHIDSTFFSLLAIACIVLWQQRRHNALLAGAGILAGLTTTFLQPKGFFLFLAFLAWLIVLHRRRLAPLTSLAVVAVGYLGVIGLTVLYFWSKGALASLIFANFTWPRQHYGTVNSVTYAHGILSQYFDVWIINQPGFRWTIALASFIFIPFLFIATLPALVLALGARFRWNLESQPILLYWLCGIGIWLSEIHRPDVPRLVFGSPLLIILCIHFLTQYGGSLAKASLQILSISAVFLVAFNLTCVLLAAHTIPTRVGTVRMLKEAPVLAYLNEHVAPGEEIFAYPYCPRYYFLSATVNPTPYSILVYNYNTQSQFQDVVRILEQRKVKYVLWDSNFAQATVDVFPGSTQPPPGGFIVEPYLESHYKLIQVVGGIRIMVRNSQPQLN
jgi:4-amino-4-deoxy-L-arabinose transferase-like glycosyltransferase